MRGERSWTPAEGVPAIVWRPLSDVRIEIRTAAAWRPANRSPLLKALIGLLPKADVATAPVRGSAPMR